MLVTLREEAIARKRADLDRVRGEVLSEHEQLVRHNDEVDFLIQCYSIYRVVVVMVSVILCRSVAMVRFI